MCVYMGSMLVLFSDFFIKRYVLSKHTHPISTHQTLNHIKNLTNQLHSYILKQPAVDMCGVIKSVDFSGGQTAAAYHGNARLGPTGAATVFLPRHFREVWIDRCTNAVEMYLNQISVCLPHSASPFYLQSRTLTTPPTLSSQKRNRA